MERIYFRFEDQNRAVGEIIERDASLPPPLSGRGPKVERILELYRPEDCLPRRECVYSLDHEDYSRAGIQTSKRFIHSLRLIGPVEQRDMVWIGALQKKHPEGLQTESAKYHMRKLASKDPNTRHSDEEIARWYWSGISSASPDFEYVARSAQVLGSRPLPGISWGL